MTTAIAFPANITILQGIHSMGETSLIRHVRQWVREQIDSNESKYSGKHDRDPP
jgi:hypothetical protein